MTPVVAETIFPAKTECLDDVLGMVEKLLGDAGCPAETIMNIAIAVEEIFVNIAHYAYGDGEGEAIITCRLTREPACVSITFSDGGKPFNPLEREDPDIGLDADSRGIGGLGIYMVKESMDSVEYQYEGRRNVLTITKAF